MLFAPTAFNFRDYILYLQQVGFYDVFLPFLLVFAITFAILEKTKIFGDDKSRINLVIALVIGLLLVAQKGIVNTINTFLPSVSLILVVVLAFLLVLTLIAGKEYKGLQGPLFTIALIACVIALIFALSPTIPSFLSPSERDTLIAIGVPVGVLLLCIWFLVGRSKKEGEEGGGISKFLKEMDKGFK